MSKRALVVAAVLAAVAFSAQAQDKWLIGQSAPLSGGNAKFGQDIREGANAYFAAVNARGGVQGKQIELVTLDDKNDRKLAGENTKKLLDRNVLALFGYASATLSLDAMPQAQAREVPFFAPFSGANPVRANSPTLFTVRASYGDEMEKIINFWLSLGMKRVTVLHYDDEVGKQNFEIVSSYLKKINLQPQELSVKRNVKLGKAEVQALLAQQPQFVINTLLSGAAADLQKELTGLGRMVPTSSLSFVGAEQYIEAAGPASAGVSIAQVVPSPGNTALAAVHECGSALRAAGIKTPMNSTQLEACFAAKVLTEGMKRAKKPLTSRSLIDALANLGTYDLGGYKVSFAPGAQHGSKYVELDMVTREGKLSSR